MAGADLANLINQAALHGSAAGNEAVTREDIDFARDKIIMGPERRSAVIEEQNRKLVAYHEGGHAIMALFTPGPILILPYPASDISILPYSVSVTPHCIPHFSFKQNLIFPCIHTHCGVYVYVCTICCVLLHHCVSSLYI